MVRGDQRNQLTIIIIIIIIIIIFFFFFFFKDSLVKTLLTYGHLNPRVEYSRVV